MSIDRFVKAYKSYFIVAEEEILNCHIQTRWMWFIFPQLRGINTSMISNYYSLSGIEEAQLFYANKYLKNNFRRLTKLLLRFKKHDSLEKCFGISDTERIRSSMTIFYIATKDRLFKKVLSKFFEGCLDKQTMLLLNYEV